MKPYIVLLVRGGRVASIEYTEENLALLKKDLYLIPKFVNDDGTTYFEASPKPKRSK